jgi:beta-lactamase regulating signal transducer with metallopeptidase domain
MFAALVEAALRGSVLLATTWVVLKALRLRDIAAEKNVWTLVAAASLAMPLLSRAVVSIAPSFAVLPSQPSALPAELQGMNPGLVAGHATNWISIVYLLGMAALMVRFAIGLWISSRVRRHARRLAGPSMQGLDVRVSTAMRGPASFVSTILLPPGCEFWDRSMLAAVLAHEQAHIRNRDGYRLWLATMYRAAFWFNPLAHLLYRRLQMLSELTSDEAAAAAMGDRAAYADVLRRVASQPRLFTATVAMAIRSTLNGRLKRLVEEPAPCVHLGRRQNALLVCATFVFIALAAVVSGRATTMAAERIATLEFYLVDQFSDAYTAQQTGKVPAGDRLYKERDGRPVLLKREAVASSAELTQVSTKQTENGFIVQVRLNERGAASLLRITRQNIGSRMAVVYTEHTLPRPRDSDRQVPRTGIGQVISQAVIRGSFGREFQITGLNAEEATTLASQFGRTLPP